MRFENRVVLGTGWYADNRGHNNPKASRELYKPGFFRKWFQNIYAYFTPDAVCCYTSQCETLPDIRLTSGFVPEMFTFINSFTPNDMLHHGHDGLAAIIAGCVLAELNGAHFIYVEQDCLVHNINLLIHEQITNNVMLGYGLDNANFKKGWSEYSVLWVHNKFLKFFLTQMLNKEPHNDRREFPEVLLHEIFQTYVTPFRNGFGRKRPIDWSLDWFYAQQVNDAEIAKFETLAMVNVEETGRILI